MTGTTMKVLLAGDRVIIKRQWRARYGHKNPDLPQGHGTVRSVGLIDRPGRGSKQRVATILWDDRDREEVWNVTNLELAAEAA